jgi:hypothetical protein
MVQCNEIIAMITISIEVTTMVVTNFFSEITLIVKSFCKCYKVIYLYVFVNGKYPKNNIVMIM